MSSKPLLNNDTILHDFIRAMEPDISETDLQSFVSDFMSNETKQNVILAQRSKAVLNENIAEPKAVQHEMLVRLVKEAVFHFLDTKYKESTATDKVLTTSSNLLMEDPSEMKDLKHMVDQLVSEKEKMSQRLEQLEGRQSLTSAPFFQSYQINRWALLLLLCGIVAITFFVLNQRTSSLSNKNSLQETRVNKAHSSAKVSFFDQVQRQYMLALSNRKAEITLSNNKSGADKTSNKTKTFVDKSSSTSAYDSVPTNESGLPSTEETSANTSLQRKAHGGLHYRGKRSSRPFASQRRSAKTVKSKSSSKANNQKGVYFGEQY